MFVSLSASPGFRFSRKKLRSSRSGDASGHAPGRAVEHLLGRDFRKGEMSTSMADYGTAEKDVGCWRVLGSVPRHIHLSSVLVKLSWSSPCRSSPGGAWWGRTPWCALQILLLCPGETRLLFSLSAAHPAGGCSVPSGVCTPHRRGLGWNAFTSFREYVHVCMISFFQLSFSIRSAFFFFPEQ